MTSDLPIPQNALPCQSQTHTCCAWLFFGCGVATFRCPAEVVSPQNVNVDGDGDEERRDLCNWNILVEPWISFH